MDVTVIYSGREAHISLGTNPKVVQELLGHSQIAVMMDVYSHVLPTMQQDAMADMDRLLSA